MLARHRYSSWGYWRRGAAKLVTYLVSTRRPGQMNSPVSSPQIAQLGGSLIRPQATGYGARLFRRGNAQDRGQSLEGKVCTVSGVGQRCGKYTVQKLNRVGAKVVTMSDSSGFIYDKNGITEEKLGFIMHLKNVRRRRIKEYAEARWSDLHGWSAAMGSQMPTGLFRARPQNEITKRRRCEATRQWLLPGFRGSQYAECPAAVDLFVASKILFGPGKSRQCWRRGYIRP